MVLDKFLITHVAYLLLIGRKVPSGIHRGGGDIFLSPSFVACEQPNMNKQTCEPSLRNSGMVL